MSDYDVKVSSGSVDDFMKEHGLEVAGAIAGGVVVLDTPPSPPQINMSKRGNSDVKEAVPGRPKMKM